MENMIGKKKWSSAAVLAVKVLAVCVVTTAFADDADKKAPPAAKKPATQSPVPDKNLDPAAWNIDAMISQAGDRVSKRYNCNEEQTQLTRQMMEAGVKKFIQDNQDEVWSLLRELMPYQAKGSLPDPETAQRIAKRLLPLIDKAEQAIHEANDFWAQQLAPEQRKLYDYDRAEMDGILGQMKTNFKKWEAGEVVEQPIFPQQKPNPDAPKVTNVPTPDEISSTRKNPEMLATSKTALMNEFKRYVEKFIKDYQLDATQAEADCLAFG